MTTQVDIQGHRGARGLFPENTLEGFKAAFALGITAFELDVGMTIDDVVVVSHDLALNPEITRDPSGAWLPARGPLISALTHTDLCRYDVGRIKPGSSTAGLFPCQSPHDGARIPTLANVLAALPDARFTIEVKTDPTQPEATAPPHRLADATLAVIDAVGAVARIVIESFDWRVQRHVRQTRPDIRLAWLTQADTVRNAAVWWDGITSVSSVAACVAAEGGAIWAPHYINLSQVQIQEAHALGLSVMPWTVNRASDIERMIHWGVDALISDRPDVAMNMCR